MWYVYFLHLNNGDLYVGSTDDLRRRFASHQKGQVLSTKLFLPLTLKSYGSGKALAKKRLIEP